MEGGEDVHDEEEATAMKIRITIPRSAKVGDHVLVTVDGVAVGATIEQEEHNHDSQSVTFYISEDSAIRQYAAERVRRELADPGDGPLFVIGQSVDHPPPDHVD